MKIRLIIAVFVAKLTIRLCRLVRWGGTTFPGKLAQRLYPRILQELSKGYKIIMVTGTNGKTTTVRIIGRILKDNGITYITNKSGANLMSGIITTFAENAGFKADPIVSTALIEIDEAAFRVITDFITPDILVVTNFFRDQLDRYGELYSTLKGVASGISKSADIRLVLNADDSLCASLGRNIPNKVIYYGFHPGAYSGTEETANSDARFCIYCKTRYEYSGFVYGHLGQFRCPACGYEKPDADVACVSVGELTSSFSSIGLSLDKPVTSVSYAAKVNLPGLYNIYNALAALACSRLLGLDTEKSISSLANFECGFGRMEEINTDRKIIKVILVKNPTGFNQVLNYLLTESKSFQLAFLINDNTADGTDISWLWDVDFEKLQNISHLIGKAYTSGIRAEDMAVRLKYSGIETSRIIVETNYGQLLEKALAETPEGHSLYILPTYTAMLDIRKLLKRKYVLKDFWK